MKSPVHGYQVDDVAWWGFYETVCFRADGYGYQTFRTMLGLPVIAIRQLYNGNWTSWQKLATTDKVATKFDVTVNATSNPIDDIKTVVNQLVNMSTKTTTYCGSIYRRSSGGIQGCFGNYDISVYIVDNGAYAGNTHINGTLTFGMGGNSNVEDTYSVSCSIDVKGSGETYWNIGKLATTDDILENNYNGSFMGATVAWFKTSNLFAYPNAGGFWSSTFLLSDRDGAWTGILKIADDGASSTTATIVSLGASPRGGEEFYYDETSYCLYFCGTWDRITITQLTGKKADLSITSTTQEEAKQNIKIVPINVATTTLPTLNGTCKGLADSECYATFDVTFDSWGGSSPAIIGIAVDGAYVNSKALIMVNNSIETASDKKVRILYADGVNCLFRVFALAPSLYSNTIKVYVSFYTVGTDDYSFKVQQRDYIGAISNLNVTNDSAGMPVSSWFQSIAQPSAPVLTTDVTSTVTQGSTAPITSGGVYNAIVKRYSTESLYPSNLGLATGTVALEDLCEAINITLGSDCCIRFAWDSSSAIALNVNGTIVSLAGSVLQGHFEQKNMSWRLSEGWFTDEEGNMYSFRCRTQGGTTPNVVIKKLS